MGTNGTDMATAPASAARGEAVDRARQSWIRKLIDLSRRNNLLYYRPLSLGKLRKHGKPRGPRQTLVSATLCSATMFSTKKPRKRLSELEHLLMDVLWARPQSTAEDVREALTERHPMKDSTSPNHSQSAGGKGLRQASYGGPHKRISSFGTTATLGCEVRSTNNRSALGWFRGAIDCGFGRSRPFGSA
jgi:hypothetical protein